jgi:NADH-quinone oxidoreductase subunit J
VTFYAIIFYILAGLLVVSTGLAVSRRRLVHAVIFLIISFFATALLFYLLGAPFLAALEVIIYAGAIMVMFLFIIMTLKLEKGDKSASASGSWLPAIVLGGISLVLLATLLWTGPDHSALLKPAMAAPREFGKYIFREFWFSVEVASFLLFVALVGALYLAREKGGKGKMTDSEQEAS